MSKLIFDRRQQRRERAMIALLELALREIEHELEAAGPDEVAQHPMFRDKERFVSSARKRIAKWKA
jgi:hypothetical protein